MPFSPAASAAEPSCTSITATPLIPYCAVIILLSSLSMVIPSFGLSYFPFAISCGTIRLTVSTGTASPIPAYVPEGL